MDDDRFSSYLQSNAKQGTSADSKKKGGSSRKGEFQVSLQTALKDARLKLGLKGIPVPAALALVVLVAGLCFLGAYTYSPTFRSLIAGDVRSEESVIVNGQGSGDPSAPGLTGEDSSADSSDTACCDDESHGNDLIYVYVSGAVNKPDVYELPVCARAVDAIRLAEGFKEDAAAEALNLAAPLEDGTQIHILTRKEFEDAGGNTAFIIAPAAPGDTAAPGGSSPGMSADGLVNVNLADSALLQTLPGVGPVTADKIVADREANGPYASIEDLARVSGIGPKRVEALEGIASVGP